MVNILAIIGFSLIGKNLAKFINTRISFDDVSSNMSYVNVLVFFGVLIFFSIIAFSVLKHLKSDRFPNGGEFILHSLFLLIVLFLISIFPSPSIPYLQDLIATITIISPMDIRVILNNNSPPSSGNTGGVYSGFSGGGSCNGSGSGGGNNNNGDGTVGNNNGGNSPDNLPPILTVMSRLYNSKHNAIRQSASLSNNLVAHSRGERINLATLTSDANRLENSPTVHQEATDMVVRYYPHIYEDF